MSNNTIEGWSNGETWAVYLWYSNEQRQQAHARKLRDAARDGATATDAYTQGTWTREQAEYFTLADSLRAWIEDLAVEAHPCSRSTPVDLLRLSLVQQAIGNVNWRELAEHLLDNE